MAVWQVPHCTLLLTGRAQEAPQESILLPYLHLLIYYNLAVLH